MPATTATGTPEPTRARGCRQPLAPRLPAARVDALTELFRALSDPVRLEILHLLARAETPVCVCDITATLDLSQPTVSHHLARLRDAGLVTGERRGVWSHWRVHPDLSDAGRVALALVG